MRTEQINYFLEAAKAGSITKAAANLHMQQPSLREAIINLENELGQPLFNRTKKGVELTEYGQRCLPHLQSMYDTYLQMKQDNLPPAQRDKFIIATQSAFDHYMPQLYSLLSHTFNQQTLKINYIEDCDQIINSVIRGTSDVGLISNVCDYLAQDAFYLAQLNKAFAAHTLYQDQLGLVVSPNHPLAQKEVIQFTDLYHQTLVFTNSSAPTLSFLQKRIDLKQCELLNVFNYKLAESYCLYQNFVTFLPQESSYNTTLLTKPFNEPMPIDFKFLYRQGQMTPQILTCLTLLRSLLLVQ